MANQGGTLPDNPEDLRGYCEQLLAELRSKNQLIDKLSHELALFRRYLYGRRSEKLDPAQLLLEFASWLKAMNEPVSAETEGGQDAPPSPPAPAPPRPPGHGRKLLPGFLPRRRVEHALPEAQCVCGECGARLVKIGEETSEQLDYTPAPLFVTEHVRGKYACKACEGHVVTSAMPAQPIDKGRPGPGLLAQVITAKYADHLPLNRQVDIFARHQVDLSRQTLCDWVADAAVLLEPIYRDLKASVLGGKVVQTDDTTVPIQDRARTTTRDGRLWVYVGDKSPADIVYDYTPTRSRAGPGGGPGGWPRSAVGPLARTRLRLKHVLNRISEVPATRQLGLDLLNQEAQDVAGREAQRAVLQARGRNDNELTNPARRPGADRSRGRRPRAGSPRRSGTCRDRRSARRPRCAATG